jgi:hypothetical protein
MGFSRMVIEVGFGFRPEYQGPAYHPRGAFFGAPYDASRFALGAPVGSFAFIGETGAFTYEIGAARREVFVQRFGF